MANDDPAIATHRAAIGVGSNIDPQIHLPQALDLLAAENRIIAQSEQLTTSPIGITDQPDFVNCAWLIETEMNLDALNRHLKQIEASCNRVRTGEKFGPRTVDLDVVVWNGRIIDTDYHSRPFLRELIAQILPDLESHAG